jgi:hypothetical protein
MAISDYIPNLGGNYTKNGQNVSRGQYRFAALNPEQQRKVAACDSEREANALMDTYWEEILRKGDSHEATVRILYDLGRITREERDDLLEKGPKGTPTLSRRNPYMVGGGQGGNSQPPQQNHRRGTPPVTSLPPAGERIVLRNPTNGSEIVYVVQAGDSLLQNRVVDASNNVVGKIIN